MYLDKTELSVLQEVQRQQMMSPGSLVLVGCSGGPDSVALLYLLVALAARLRIKPAVCHFNHCLRGKESDEDAAFVGRLAHELDLPFFGGSGNVAGYADEHGLSLEEAARRLRYAFFEQVIERTGAGRVAIAHHADDNAETILINLLRGSGSRGLSGIPPVRGNYVRPLLRLRRHEIIAYLEKSGIKYRIDSSNFENDFLRNRLRQQIMPQFLEINPGLIDTLNRSGEVFREEDRLLDDLAQAWLAKFGNLTDAGCEVDSARLKAINQALQRRVFRLLYLQCHGNMRRLSLAHADAFLQLVLSDAPGAVIDLPGGFKARCVYDKIVIERHRRHGKSDCRPQRIPVPGELEWPPFLIIAEILPSPIKPFPPRDSDRVLFPLQLTERDLAVRPARRGEKMRPFGGRTKKVSDLFIDARIERRRRANYPLLADDKGILWIPGVARSDRFPLPDDSGACILIRCIFQE